MGEIQYSHHAEDEREPGRHHEKHHAVGEPVYALGNIHRRSWIHNDLPSYHLYFWVKQKHA